MSSKFSIVKGMVVTAALVASVSGLARADDTRISIPQYQAWMSDSPMWQLNPPVFDKTPSSFHQSYPHGLPVSQYQAWSSPGPAWRLDAPVFDKAPSAFRQSHPHGLSFREYQAMSSDSPVWQLPNQSATTAFASTNEDADAKTAASKPAEGTSAN